MWKRIVVAGLVAVLGAGLAAWLWLEDLAKATHDAAYFEDAIRAFERADADAPPEAGRIVFVGSSSIRMWRTLEADMAPLPVLNRGFGGSQLSHLVHNAKRIVTPYRPRAVVVYAGDNDLAAGTGKSAESVFADWLALVELLREELPDVDLYFLAIKPSIRRWARWPEMRRANASIEAHAAGDPKLGYIDVATPLLGPDRVPNPDFFVFDGLHMNAAGYAAWTSVVRPRLLAEQSEPD